MFWDTYLAYIFEPQLLRMLWWVFGVI